MDAGNWIALALGVGTLALGGLNTYAQWPAGKANASKGANRSLLIVLASMAIVVGAVSYDVYDRHHVETSPGAFSWGAAGDSYYMAVVTQDIKDLAKSHRLMMVVRPNLMGADPLADLNIGKSGLYTITGGVVMMTVPLKTPLRMVPNQQNMMDYDAVLLPLGITPERIHSLADVTEFGGRIYQGRGTAIFAGPPLDATSVAPPTAGATTK